MADEDLSLEEPNEAADTEEGEGAGGNKKMIIIIAAAVVVLLIGGGVAAYLLLGGDSDEGSEPVAEAEITEVADGDDASESGPVDAVPAPEKGEAIYIGVAEPFLVNIKSGKRSRMMQIKIQFMVRSKEAEDAVKLHMPLIRNNLLDFFSTADAKVVSTREGRTELKDGALKAAQKVVKDQVGFEAIEMILFTGFVIQ